MFQMLIRIEMRVDLPHLVRLLLKILSTLGCVGLVRLTLGVACQVVGFEERMNE
jgi:hypothetical protein